MKNMESQESDVVVFFLLSSCWTVKFNMLGRRGGVWVAMAWDGSFLVSWAVGFSFQLFDATNEEENFGWLGL